MTLFTNAELDHLHTTSTALFRLVSPDGDQGFPGALLIETLVTLVAPVEQERHYVKPGDTVEPVEYELGSVVIVYRAKLQTENTVTPVNLTQVRSFSDVCPLAVVAYHCSRILSTGASTWTRV